MVLTLSAVRNVVSGRFKYIAVHFIFINTVVFITLLRERGGCVLLSTLSTVVGKAMLFIDTVNCLNQKLVFKS